MRPVMYLPAGTLNIAESDHIMLHLLNKMSPETKRIEMTKQINNEQRAACKTHIYIEYVLRDSGDVNSFTKLG